MGGELRVSLTLGRVYGRSVESFPHTGEGTWVDC